MGNFFRDSLPKLTAVEIESVARPLPTDTIHKVIQEPSSKGTRSRWFHRGILSQPQKLVSPNNTLFPSTENKRCLNLVAHKKGHYRQISLMHTAERNLQMLSNQHGCHHHNKILNSHQVRFIPAMYGYKSTCKDLRRTKPYFSINTKRSDIVQLPFLIKTHENRNGWILP